MQAADESKFKGIKDSISKLVEGLQGEQATRDLVDERKTKEIKLTENNLQIELNVEK